MAYHYDPHEFAVYRHRNLCMEKRKVYRSVFLEMITL